jgi:hypothetical protein
MSPGELWRGCLSLGDDPELMKALDILKGQEGISHDDKTLACQQTARALVLDYLEKALSSPEGRRLYPEAIAQMVDPLHK